MRIAIISDIHEDIERLKSAMAIMKKKNIDEIVCLGDIVGFNIPFYNYYDTRNASECIQIIKSNCNTVLVGNHDLFEAEKIPFHQAGFDFPEDWFLLDYKEKESLAKGKVWLHEKNSLSTLISKQEKEYLYSLPEYKIVDLGGQRILFSHFLHPDFTGSRSDFFMSDNVFGTHLEFMKKNKCTISFSGHAHFEGACYYNEKKRKVKSFGKTKIKKELCGYIGPCIAKGKQSNGFMIFDTDAMELEIIPLGLIQKMKQSVSNILKKNTSESVN